MHAISASDALLKSLFKLLIKSASEDSKSLPRIQAEDSETRGSDEQSQLLKT
jgi:hypothetical protein